MFQLFTEEAIKAVIQAQAEARRCHHNYVSTEQILLGLVYNSLSTTGMLFKKFGIFHIDVRRETDKIIGLGNGSGEEIPFTPTCKVVFILARDEAELRRHSYIGSEHLLKGLVKHDRGLAPRVLDVLGIDVAILKADLEKEFGPPSDDFEKIFYPIKTADIESLKTNIRNTARILEQAREEGQTTTADSALQKLMSLEYMLPWEERDISRGNET